MYQLTFSEQSLSELDKFTKDEQLQLVSRISELSEKAFKNEDSSIPNFCRDGKTYFRLKVDMLRVYVEKINSDALYCHYVLPQHTLSDFLFRSKFPVSEMQMIEQHSSFWKYLESLKSNTGKR
ncbi:MAG: cytotoxic translational repressor of toxin-antitoxin stability system [Puniceicoccales bacterium]|jgi:mRNA interferase RelE/StbE|nr:cytotoxic translational repressor of toxin-antitoxin stability system [Puniceicoccales bacterium]